MAVNISYDVDYGSRNAVLTQLGLAAGLTATALGPSAGETHPNWVQQVNKINVALGLPTYSSLDMNAFQTVVAAMVAKINAPPPAPTNSVAPVASFSSGTGALGSVCTVTNGTWTGSPTFTYQWLRSGANIALNGTGATYTLVAADSGNPITCRVTGTNGGGNASATSNALTAT
jgi:hypothetical protein